MGMVIADAKPVVVGMRCDACGEGMMEPVENGVGVFEAYATNPPLYKHRCSKCGAAQLFHTKFPNIQLMFDDREFRELKEREREALRL